MENNKIDFIKRTATFQSRYISGSSTVNGQTQLGMIESLEKAFLNEAEVDGNILFLVDGGQYDYVYRYLKELLLDQLVYIRLSSKPYFDFDDPVVNQIVTKKNINSGGKLKELAQQYITKYFDNYDQSEESDFIDYLQRKEFTDKELLETYVNGSNSIFFFNKRISADYGLLLGRNSLPLNAMGYHLQRLLSEQKMFFAIRKSKDYFEIINSIVNASGNKDKSFFWFLFQLLYYPIKLEGNIKQYLLVSEDDKVSVDLRVAYSLLTQNARKYENLILETINSVGGISESEMLEILIYLDKKNKGKYEKEIMEAGEAYIRKTFYTPDENSKFRYQEMYINKQPVSISYIKNLIRTDTVKGKNYLKNFVSEAAFIFPYNMEQLDEVLGDEALPLFVELLFKKATIIDKVPRYFQTLFERLKKYKAGEYLDQIIDFAVNHANKYEREMACNYLSKQIPEVIEPVKELLSGKKINQRAVAALVLSKIDRDDVSDTLNMALSKEINDDVRDVMLEAVAEKRFAKPFTIGEIEEMVAAAEKRKKLKKWNEKWLEEENLPNLFWEEKKSLVDKNVIRFLFYRMKRAKGINSDIEAKQIIQLIDKEKSEKFAIALLSAFQDSNADNKIKYYLTLSGLLGGDAMTQKLNALISKSIADKRMKMAENIIGALAMVGSDKALRSVETIYRKMANKKPKLSQTAKEALDAAALELNISSDELSDRLIPDFGFEGQYKNIEIDGDEYRAFVSNDFKINFLNEDNKIRKNLPSNAPKELKTEFKEIQKEIKDVVKSQDIRLEKYLVDERRWTVSEWRQFFFENPILFVYSMKLLWGVFDADGQLISSFYCSEDASLYDVNDEEIELSEDNFIGILHPLYLEEELCEQWKDKLYEMGIITVFPIIDRKVFRVENEESEAHSTRCFYNKNVPKGADYVGGFLLKRNWMKSASDGGGAVFSRLYRDGEIVAWANIEGPAMFYLGGETPATVYEISFRNKQWKDKIMLKDLPKVFYSEVLSDIDQLIKTE